MGSRIEKRRKTGTLIYYSGARDYFEDQVSFTVDEVNKKVTDDGYTTYLFETFDKTLMNYRSIIQMYGVTLENTQQGALSVSYEGNQYENAGKRLNACVMELIDLGFRYDN